MSELINGPKKHISKSRETIPLKAHKKLFKKCMYYFIFGAKISLDFNHTSVDDSGTQVSICV
jgi:hypothetical protein